MWGLFLNFYFSFWAVATDSTGCVRGCTCSFCVRREEFGAGPDTAGLPVGRIPAGEGFHLPAGHGGSHGSS